MMFGWNTAERLGRFEERCEGMESDLEEWKDRMVTKAEFEPVKKVVFGLVGALLLAIVTTAVGLIFQRPTATPVSEEVAYPMAGGGEFAADGFGLAAAVAAVVLTFVGAVFAYSRVTRQPPA